MTNYQYDQLERLTQAAGPGGPFKYTLDGNANRIKSSVSFKPAGLLAQPVAMAYLNSGQTERTQAGGSSFKNGPMGLSINSSGPLSSTSYVRTPEGELVSMRTGGVAHYYLFDRLGSVVALTDSAGSPVNRYFYDPFGNYETGTTEMVANPWQFAGGFKDSFSGYYKFGARYYDPTLGRWTQPDPSGQDANSYVYAGSCPNNFIDPSGLKFDPIKSVCSNKVVRVVTGIFGVTDIPNLTFLVGTNAAAFNSQRLATSTAAAATSVLKIAKIAKALNGCSLAATVLEVGCRVSGYPAPGYPGLKKGR